MKNILELEKKIAPEILRLIEKRYNILRSIYYNQPIGRRTLSNQLKIGERSVRTEINVLKNQGLLEVESVGMHITEEGKFILEDLKDFIHSLKGLSKLEKTLENILYIKKVLIVPGDSDENKLILKDMGKTAAKYLKKIVKDNDVIGITGGSTMASVASEMPSEKTGEDILVLPARGGLGRNVETQANNIAAELAKKMKGSYRLLHVPDNIQKEALDVILKMPELKETIEIIKNIDILLFGIGRADVMAERRKLSTDTITELMKRGAVSEAFGHYFNTHGDIIWESMTVGLSVVNFNNIKNVIGVAGGEKKAEAILSICSLRNEMVLVTDEGAARKILKLVNKAI